MKRLALRLSMFAYALSCAGNVLGLTRPEDTSEGESISGRAFWESRYGKHAGASKGSKPAPKAKVKPKINKGKIGFTYTQMQLTTVAGTPTFDAGSVSVVYET